MHADSNFVVLPFDQVGTAVQLGLHGMSRYIHLSFIVYTGHHIFLVSACLSTDKKEISTRLSVFTYTSVESFGRAVKLLKSSRVPKLDVTASLQTVAEL